MSEKYAKPEDPAALLSSKQRKKAEFLRRKKRIPLCETVITDGTVPRAMPWANKKWRSIITQFPQSLRDDGKVDGIRFEWQVVKANQEMKLWQFLPRL